MCLEEFDTILQNFDQILADHVLESHKVCLLKKVANADNWLLGAWTAIKTIISKSSPGAATRYLQYIEYLVAHAKKLEENSNIYAGLKEHMAESNFMALYYPYDMK